MALLCLMEVVRHIQRTQSRKLVIFLQYIKKKMLQLFLCVYCDAKYSEILRGSFVFIVTWYLCWYGITTWKSILIWRKSWKIINNWNNPAYTWWIFLVHTVQLIKKIKKQFWQKYWLHENIFIDLISHFTKIVKCEQKETVVCLPWICKELRN